MNHNMKWFMFFYQHCPYRSSPFNVHCVSLYRSNEADGNILNSKPESLQSVKMCLYCIVITVAVYHTFQVLVCAVVSWVIFEVLFFSYSTRQKHAGGSHGT